MKTKEPIRCACPDDGKDYMHGFYSVQPWDRAGRRMLAHRLPFVDRMPTGAEPAELGLQDPDRREFTPLALTRAWNFQLGCLAHWVDGADGTERILFNDRRGDRFVSVMRDPAGGAERVFDSPVFTVSHDGRYALGYDFARLQPLRPGYAYAGVPYPLQERTAPADEGVMHLNLDTGETRMILSYAGLAAAFPHTGMGASPVFVSRLLCSPDDCRIVLSFRFRSAGDGAYHTCLATVDRDGSNLHEVAGYADRPAHFDWCGSDRLAVWLQPPAATVGGFHLIADRTGGREPLGHGLLTRDGHCSFGVDTHRMLLDSFPDDDGMQNLLVFDREKRAVKRLGRFRMPSEFGWSNHGGDLRCDLHPCWDRGGTRVCFDSFHEGRRAVYVADVEHSGSVPAARQSPDADNPCRRGEGRADQTTKETTTWR